MLKSLMVTPCICVYVCSVWDDRVGLSRSVSALLTSPCVRLSISYVYQTPFSTSSSHVQRPPPRTRKTLGGAGSPSRRHHPLEIRTQSLLERLSRLGLHLLRRRRSINFGHTPLLPKVLHHRHTRLHKRTEPLANTLFIIIRPPTRLPTFQQPLFHRRLGTVIKQHKFGGTDALFELERLVELAGEAVDEEPLGGGEGGLHGVLEKGDGDFHGDDFAVFDVVFDELAVLGAFAVLFGAEEVAGAEVGEAVAVDEAGALGSLSGAGAAEDEDYCEGGERVSASFLRA